MTAGWSFTPGPKCFAAQDLNQPGPPRPAARKHGLTISCDLNYRRRLWRPEQAQRVMTGLMQYVDVLIGNEEDAALVLGVVPAGVDVAAGALDVERYAEVARELHARFGFKIVATTLRENLSAAENNWSGLLFDGTDCYVSRKYHIQVVDRVGSGDAFSGAVIYGLLTELGGQATVDFAVAAACLKHSIHGDFNLVSRVEVDQLVAGGGAGRIER